MGAQKKITKQIVEDDGDFVLARKNNHGKLRQGVEQIFAEALAGSLTDIQPASGQSHLICNYSGASRAACGGT